MRIQKCLKQMPAAASQPRFQRQKRKGRSSSQGAAKKEGFAIEVTLCCLPLGSKAKSAPGETSHRQATRCLSASSPQSKAESKAVGKARCQTSSLKLSPHWVHLPLPSRRQRQSPPRHRLAQQRQAHGRIGMQAKGKGGRKAATGEPLWLPRSHPHLFAVDWSRFTSREAFLQQDCRDLPLGCRTRQKGTITT